MVKQYSNMLKYMLFDVAPCRKDQSYKEPNNAMRPREVRLQKRPRGLGLKCHFPNNCSLITSWFVLYLINL